MTVSLIEDCFDGSFRKEIHLDQPISEPFIRYLGNMGVLQYFPHFPRPFFRVDAPTFMLKGIQDNATMQLLLYKPELENELLQFINHFPLPS